MLLLQFPYLRDRTSAYASLDSITYVRPSKPVAEFPETLFHLVPQGEAVSALSNERRTAIPSVLWEKRRLKLRGVDRDYLAYMDELL